MPRSLRSRPRSAAEHLRWGYFRTRFVHRHLLIPLWGSSSAHPTPPNVLPRDGGTRVTSVRVPAAHAPRPGPTPGASRPLPRGRCLQERGFGGASAYPHREAPHMARIPSSKARSPVNWRGENPGARVEQGREPGMAVSCQAAPIPCPRHSGGLQGGLRPQIWILEPGEGERSELLNQSGFGSPRTERKAWGVGGRARPSPNFLSSDAGCRGTGEKKKREGNSPLPRGLCEKLRPCSRPWGDPHQQPQAGAGPAPGASPTAPQRCCPQPIIKTL